MNKLLATGIVMLFLTGSVLAQQQTTDVQLLRKNIPNTFTPNRDGINDTWEIKGLAEITTCKVQVFNQWGSLVFTSDGYPRPWDGKHQGNVLPTASYYYVIHFNNNKDKPISGSVTIVK
ncbi:gliding motility-associated C-terminal domain-containing protein [Pontibacter qinzhouensis]|uniref:Gliding motility-associated C-terminal domain-containing protein n=1 Tax=Pontibacter qinzhouensis TaxID=2603253 RepID=A0A5C8J8T8_9BACT|nr:gliding motility-associated C-terminal domain-containing protein [Pontibacter qinzhouensis]TXK33852.1 gliding motility-associated C-terminal domain-containing protein [Pontibacter qinzhouensis]